MNSKTMIIIKKYTKFPVWSRVPIGKGGVNKNTIIIDNGMKATMIHGLRRPYLVWVLSEKYPRIGSLIMFQNDQITKPTVIKGTGIPTTEE